MDDLARGARRLRDFHGGHAAGQGSSHASAPQASMQALQRPCQSWSSNPSRESSRPHPTTKAQCEPGASCTGMQGNTRAETKPAVSWRKGRPVTHGMHVAWLGSRAEHLLSREDMPLRRFLGRSYGGGRPEAGLRRCQQRPAQQRGLAVRLGVSATASDTPNQCCSLAGQAQFCSGPEHRVHAHGSCVAPRCESGFSPSACSCARTQSRPAARTG